MRIVRFLDDSAGRVVYGALRDDGTAEVLDGAFPAFQPSGRFVRPGPLLAPIVPADILCIGLNYRAHADEQGTPPPKNPMLFIKSGNALAGPQEPVPLPPNSSRPDYEAELVVVIARDAKRVPRSRALDHVFGYTCANDVSARDWQKEKDLNGGQFARGKSFDKFCPLGPAIVTADEIRDPNRLAIRCRLNGEPVQQGTTADMIFDVPALIESLSSTMTVRAGSVILTGTPAGVGMARTPPRYLRPGDVTEVEIEQVGTLTTRFVAES